MTLRYSYIYHRIALVALILACWQVSIAQSQPQSLLQHVIQERPVLAGLLTKAGLAPVLSADAPVTLLAPPESELQSLQQESPERLRAILSNHIILGSYQEKDMKDGSSIKTIGGTSLTTYRKKDYTLVNGLRIQQSDQQVKNGILHEIIGVLQI
ncbi:fasciclin domain-containing protein [Pontibacter rugosus]|uniref:Fasciclin domain-containing protein n=1 Tax=Pontibacter rugosus TaxID=1745966 RepID=A0ABW3SRL2_9BACT